VRRLWSCRLSPRALPSIAFIPPCSPGQIALNLGSVAAGMTVISGLTRSSEETIWPCQVLAYSLNNRLASVILLPSGLARAVFGNHALAYGATAQPSCISLQGPLFHSMGAVLYRNRTHKASELGGLYRSMPGTALFCIHRRHVRSRLFPALLGLRGKILP